MAQKSQSGQQSSQPESFPVAPSNTQGETQDPSSTTFRPRISPQDSQPNVQGHRVSPQDSQPNVQGHRVSIQELLPNVQGRRVSPQDSQPNVQGHRVSPQDSQPNVQGHRVSIQELLPNVQGRRVSPQDSQPNVQGHRVSIQELLPNVQGHRVSIQDTPSITYSRCFHTRGVPPVFQTRHFSNQNPSLAARAPLTKVKSVTYNSQISIQPTTQSFHSSLQSSKSPNRARVDVPPSITRSPEASVKSVESIIWTSQESIKDTSDGSQTNQHPPESSIHSLPSGSSTESSPGRFLETCRRSHSQLPRGWRLLHEAKKISRRLSLALSLAGLVIIGLVCLGQPWIHFQVPLAPPGDPAGSQTIPIDTIFFVRCSDISCLPEYDQNAYLLDFAWAFLLIASIASFVLCIILINIVFFTSSNMPMLDFSNVIISLFTGTSMILGILFYLMQAHEFLQEGMTYKLGCSFYLAWIGVFLFLITGFFSYLNYMNFWSLLAIQAIWT